MLNAYMMHLNALVKRWGRKQLLALLHKLDGIVTDHYFGQAISYDPSTVIGGLLLTSGEFEKTEMELCQEYISETSIVLDIGANIGLHSIYFSRLARNGCVIVVEPSLTTFRLLLGNIENIPNIVPMNLAVSDKGKIANFFHASDDAYSSLIDTKRKKIVSIQKVPCMRVDDIVFGLNLNRVDFVKIDVEGLEFEVLKGMSDVISHYQPVIFCEIFKGKHSNQKPDETVAFLIENGYRALVMCKGQLIEYRKHNDAFFNYLFVPRVQ